jgi:hypothetical protein
MATTPLIRQAATVFFRPVNTRLRPRKIMFNHAFFAGRCAVLFRSESSYRFSGMQNIRNDAEHQLCIVCS